MANPSAIHSTPGGSKVSTGGTPESVQATTSGSIVMSSTAATGLGSVGGTLIQTLGTGGFIADGGLSLISASGVKCSASAIVHVWAGAGGSAALGADGTPAGDPTIGDAPCGKVEENVNRANALATGMKGAMDVRDALTGLDAWSQDGPGAFMDKVGAVDDLASGLKGAQEAVQGVLHGAGTDLPDGWNDTADRVDSGVGQLLSGNVPVFLGAGSERSTPKPTGGRDPKEVQRQAAKNAELRKERKADAAENSAAGTGAQASGAAGEPGVAPGVAGATKVDIRGPAGVEMLSDTHIKGLSSGPIELKASSKISCAAGHKIETLSHVFECRATVAADIRAGAKVSIKSFGLVDVEAAAKMSLKAGGAMSLTSGGPMGLTAPIIKISGPTHITKKLLVNGSATFDKKMTVVGKIYCKETVEADGDVKAKKKLKAASAKINKTMKAKFAKTKNGGKFG